MLELNLSYDIIGLLFLAAFVAGFVDAIAGGGGMITIPALLLAGIPPLQALATNKLQSSFGSFSATLHFYKKGYINLKSCLPFALLVFIASGIGTISIQFVDTSFLRKFLPLLICAFGIYFLFSPKITEEDRATNIHKGFLMLALGGIGFYDGFFGPGTGSFLMIALIVLGGFGLTQALGNAKLYNFSTNLASLLIFTLGGNILWGIGLLMALGQFLGANLGSRLAIKYGIKIIKPLIVCISFIMVAKLIYNEFL
ncbi:hypothetical protein B6S12_01490 [Helicobacter valdiviensis]|uniref:Probable membrane transporter protein n=1 Tax=Helicobacter valdiviensis TaxID=1458358 RepID=A0A2W6MWV5_9HELI|nr:TSUP family transporter [Helicobacter valdiviensis]PZT48994.1 hypothetical protein B6S12_01490 [Helicobacter valdiviensis]